MQAKVLGVTIHFTELKRSEMGACTSILHSLSTSPLPTPIRSDQ